jgi:hypothetical protein
MRRREMRIKENSHHGYESYPWALQERVGAVFQYTAQITAIKRLLAEIRKEAVSLRGLFWTEEELKARRAAISFFDARMQATVYYTLRNIEGYLQHGWQNLIDEGENRDERVNAIQEKK